jgi:hypothetical protein
MESFELKYKHCVPISLSSSIQTRVWRYCWICLINSSTSLDCLQWHLPETSGAILVSMHSGYRLVSVVGNYTLLL